MMVWDVLWVLRDLVGLGVVRAARAILDWIPAFAGMTWLARERKPGHL